MNHAVPSCSAHGDAPLRTTARALVLTALLLGLAAARAEALTLQVDSVADTDDGMCDDAGCTLREAINASATPSVNR